MGSPRWIQVNLAAFTFDHPRDPASAHHDGLFTVYDEDGDDGDHGELERFGPRVHRR